MVKAIIGLEDLQACDVMTARVDVEGIDLNLVSSPEPEVVRAAGHHFLALYEGQKDRIVGFLDCWAYLLDPTHDLAAARLPPMFVPETVGIDRVLAELQHTRAQVAVVVDEYGGMAGMLTRRDILRQITGQIDNEFGRQEHVVEPIGDGRWLVDAAISLEELKERVGLALDGEGMDRLAGWVTAMAGHMPTRGERVEAQGCRVQVREVHGNRITLVTLERKKEVA
jgi:magnesium and cobalt transporter